MTMVDTDITYVELWVGLAQVTAGSGAASPIRRGAKCAHVWCATHAENRADFEERARQTLAAQGLHADAFDQVSLAEEMHVVPDDLFSLLAKAQQDEQKSDRYQQVFLSDLLYLTSNPRPN